VLPNFPAAGQSFRTTVAKTHRSHHEAERCTSGLLGIFAVFVVLVMLTAHGF
jgi:hypothetical protein